MHTVVDRFLAYASYSKASEAVLQHWFWKLLKSKTQNLAPLHHVFVRVRPGSLN
jgi:hypothetical protein